MTLIEKQKVPGDVFAFEGASRSFTRETKTVTNSGETDMDLAPGYPMDDNVPVVAANIANTDGLLADRLVIPAGESRQAAVVARGDVVVIKDGLPTADYAGDAINMTNFASAVTALGFVVRTEPDAEEQTT